MFNVPESQTDDSVDVLKLSELLCANLDFETRPTTLLKCVDFSSLNTLQIYRCKRALPFLEALVTYYSQGSCKLRRLDIMLLRHRDGGHDAAMQATENLLQCVSPLQHLYLDAGADRLVNIACLLRHGPSLRSLWLSTGRAAVMGHLNFRDVSTLLDSCSRLEQLATNLCPIDLGPIESVGSDFALTSSGYLPQTELEAMLDVFARQRRLHTIRVLSLPMIDYGQSPNPTASNRMVIPKSAAGMTQVTMHKFAAHLVRYLIERGSRLKLLAILALSAARASLTSRQRRERPPLAKSFLLA